MADLPRLVRTRDPTASGALLLVEAMTAMLGAARAQLGAAWRRVLLTWVDERCVPLADAGSNRGAAFRSGALDACDPPADLLPLFEAGERGEEALKRVVVERVLSGDATLPATGLPNLVVVTDLDLRTRGIP